MAVLSKMAVGEATQLVNLFKDSAPISPSLKESEYALEFKLRDSASDMKLKEFPFVVTSIADFAKEGVNTCLRYVKKGVDYSVEKVKQHPYLFAFGVGLGLGAIALILGGGSRETMKALIALIVGGDGASRETMKAPGREHRIFRDAFEANPTAYFRNLRGKGAYVSLG